MLFNIHDIKAAGQVVQPKKVRGRFDRQKRAVSKPDRFDIFLSHSFDDVNLIKGLHEKLEGFGLSVYVDWIDDTTQLDRENVTPKTALVLKQRMKASRCLFYAVSEHSSDSKWMPWELGYFDGFNSKVAILPVVTESDTNNYQGAEYLGLYPYVTHANGQLRIHKTEHDFEMLHTWLST